MHGRAQAARLRHAVLIMNLGSHGLAALQPVRHVHRYRMMPAWSRDDAAIIARQRRSRHCAVWTRRRRVKDGRSVMRIGDLAPGGQGAVDACV